MAPPARTRSVKAEATHVEPALSAGDIRRRAASGAALLTAKGIFVQVLGLLSTIVVARLLPLNQLGLYAIALTISTFLLMLGSGVGMGAALIRRPAAPEHADLRAFVALQLVVGSVLLAVVILATRPFGLVGQLTAVMVVSAPITAFGGASLVVAERQLLYKRIATAETAAMAVYYAWTVVTVFIGWGLWGLATATVARAVVGTALIIALAPTGLIWPRYDRRRIRSMLGIGLRVQTVDFVVAFRDQILVLGTAAIGSVSIVAYWSLILRALQAPQTLLFNLLRVSFPAMSRTRSAGGDPGSMLPRLLAAATILTGTLLAPLAAAPALVPLLFGDKWSPAADALVLTCLAIVIHTPVLIAGQSYLWTAGDAKSPLRASIAEAVVVVAIGLPLVPIVGVIGLAIGSVACAAVGTAILARAVDRQTHLHVFRHIRAPVLAWMAAAGVAWACAQGPGPLVIRAALSSCVAVGLYFGLLFLTRRELMLGLAREYWPWIRRRVLRRGAASVTAGPHRAGPDTGSACRRSRAHDRAASRGSAIGPTRAVGSSFRRTHRRIPTRPRGDHFDLTNLASQTRRYDAGDGGANALRRKVEWAFLGVNRRTWWRLPARVRGLYAMQAYGRWLHSLVSRNADRQMYVGTLFVRNRPALELMRHLFAERPQGSSVRVAVLGCSVGVEVYSIMWTLRRARPDLTILIDAVDISPEVLAIAEEGVYGPQTAETVHESVFERLTGAELLEMFDRNGDDQRWVKPFLREGITWRLGDAADRRLVEELGSKDLVVANNFLCHMDAPSAERCLRNFAQLTSPGGYLFISGVDLDVRTSVAIDLGWEPVPELMAEIHNGDPLVRADWPWHWWGLEPLDRRRNDWQTRYASAFRVAGRA